jgi:hypothetical protein
MLCLEPQIRVRVIEGVERSVTRRVDDVGDTLAPVLVLEDDVRARSRGLVPEEADSDAV